jgi:DNA-3-methyladenine glycosylase
VSAPEPTGSDAAGHETATVTRLPRSFFARPAPEVAEALVGKLLVRLPARGDHPRLAARIVEAEAYTEDDPASHAYRGRTARNAPLFGPPGHAYVYLAYGMHWCVNTATGVDGTGEGCLLRAAEPLAGAELMRQRRERTGRRHALAERDLLRGPARLAQAFAIEGAWSGADLCTSQHTVLDRRRRPTTGRCGSPRGCLRRGRPAVAVRGGRLALGQRLQARPRRRRSASIEKPTNTSAEPRTPGSHPGIGHLDLLIAATAELLQASLWTTNVKRFPMFAALEPPYCPRVRQPQ